MGVNFRGSKYSYLSYIGFGVSSSPSTAPSVFSSSTGGIAVPDGVAFAAGGYVAVASISF